MNKPAIRGSPEDRPWGDREAYFTDIDGNVLRFGEPIAEADLTGISERETCTRQEETWAPNACNFEAETGDLRMQRFKVVVRGRGLWVSIDDELERVGFQVTRIVDASTVEEAQERALALIAGDSKAQSLPGCDAPVLTVDLVEPSSADLSPQPGFALYADPE